MAHDLEVVAPEDFVEPAVGFGAVDFFELCGVVLGAAEGALALPLEHGVALDGLELVLLQGFELGGEVEGGLCGIWHLSSFMFMAKIRLIWLLISSVSQPI